MCNRLLPIYLRIKMNQKGMTMPQWKTSRARITTQAIIEVEVAVQDLELRAVMYEKKATKLEKVVQTAGERRYYTHDVPTSGLQSCFVLIRLP